MTKNELQQRVTARKDEITAKEIKLTEALGTIKSFVDDIKGRSAIYALIKNLFIWKELEKLITEEDQRRSKKS